MNKVVLIGRLTKNPELRFTPSTGTAVATTSIAVDKYNKKTGQKEADFIPLVFWGKNAENVANYMSKGSKIAIDGVIQTRSYDAKDGTKRYVTEVVVRQLEFLESKKGNNSNSNSNESNNYYAPSNDPFSGANFDEDITPVDDGDMPF